jgi:pimeloyl-ACP methyl ester carboxylesterase
MKTLTIRNQKGESIDQSFHPGVRAEALVVLGHGVTGNKDDDFLCMLAEELSARGWPCLRFTFSGHGASGGRADEATLSKEVSDLQDLLDTVPDDVGVVYIGYELGAAVGVLAAARDMRIRALVSVAGVTDTVGFLKRCCQVSPVLGEDLEFIGDTLSAAATVTQPWLLIHGEEDQVVPSRDGREAFEAAAGEKKWHLIPKAGHRYDEDVRQEIVDVMDEWLESCFGPARLTSCKR